MATIDLNDIGLYGNTKYSKYKDEFVEAFRIKKVINKLLLKCSLPFSEVSNIFLDFPEILIICSTEDGLNWYVVGILDLKKVFNNR